MQTHTSYATGISGSWDLQIWIFTSLKNKHYIYYIPLPPEVSFHVPIGVILFLMASYIKRLAVQTTSNYNTIK